MENLIPTLNKKQQQQRKTNLPSILKTDISCCVHSSSRGVYKTLLEHVYMRPKETLLWEKISLRCKVTSLLAFTWVQLKWNSLLCDFHFGQFERSEISNHSEFSI